MRSVAGLLASLRKIEAFQAHGRRDSGSGDPRFGRRKALERHEPQESIAPGFTVSSVGWETDSSEARNPEGERGAQAQRNVRTVQCTERCNGFARREKL
jgi:hypothetical protein